MPGNGTGIVVSLEEKKQHYTVLRPSPVMNICVNIFMNIFSSSTTRSRFPLIGPLPPLVATHSLLARSPVLLSRVPRLTSLPLLLRINFNKPLAITVLVLSLVTPLGNPVALFLVVDLLALSLLLLDALLLSKLLPDSLCLGIRDSLLAGKSCCGRWEK
jgi:hypothetical protein